MTTRPILFSGPMTRAILDGRKSQTRRVCKTHIGGYVHHLRFERHPFSPSAFVGTPAEGRVPGDDRMAWVAYDWVDNPIGVDEASAFTCPYGTIGDRMWCRETFGYYNTGRYDRPEIGGVYYRATEPEPNPAMFKRWRPSIHMPRWASRLTLEITGIRVERAQDISEADARAEGMLPNWVGDPAEFDPDHHGYLPFDADEEGNVPGCDPYDSFTARGCFARLWDSINGAKPGASWEANPWVWIVEFKRVEQEATR